MTRRSRAREVALQLLFQRDHNQGTKREELERFASNRLKDKQLEAFCLELYDGVMGRLAEIDQKLTDAAENWRLSRMASVDRNVLRMGTYELLAAREPPAVAMNEAIELARRYGSAESAAFVNGILDKVHHPTALGADPVLSPDPALGARPSLGAGFPTPPL